MIHTLGRGKFPLVAVCAGLALTGLLHSPARAELLVRQAICPPEKACLESSWLKRGVPAALLGYTACSQVRQPCQARRRSARSVTPAGDGGAASTLDVLFHPLGLAPALMIFSPYAASTSSGSGDSGSGNSGNNGTSGSGDPPGYPPGSQGSGSTGGDPQSGGAHPSGNPPVQGTPEPATVLSGLIGVGLLGLARWRKRRP
jgi:hypothetical protein